jgi:hypothetical protein
MSEESSSQTMMWMSSGGSERNGSFADPEDK